MFKGLKVNENIGLSLVEILVATIILLIAALGTFGVLASMRGQSSGSERELQAAYFGRQMLEELRAKVDQGTWNSWYLTCDGATYPWPGPFVNHTFFNTFNGQAFYNCADLGTPPVRQVNLIINWNEP